VKQKYLPWVVPEYCEGCGGCLRACKRNCLSLFATETPEVFIVWMSNPENCTGCGCCSEVCVMGGISMTSYVDDAAARFSRFIETGKVRRLSAEA
jgi:formate hydrogenlyase subunit 6/NADH:ubiquinone oxidoreductase subunit I